MMYPTPSATFATGQCPDWTYRDIGGWILKRRSGGAFGVACWRGRKLCPAIYAKWRRGRRVWAVWLYVCMRMLRKFLKYVDFAAEKLLQSGTRFRCIHSYWKHYTLSGLMTLLPSKLLLYPLYKHVIGVTQTVSGIDASMNLTAFTLGIRKDSRKW